MAWALRSQHHFHHDLIVLLFVFFSFLRSTDRTAVVSAVDLVSLVVAWFCEPSEPPCLPSGKAGGQAGGGLAAATGRHVIYHPRFSLICNDALAANRFPRARGRGSRDIARAKRLLI
jgi:hypothetical protein